MTQAEFERTIRTFDAIETMRARLYYSALDLIRERFVVEGHLLILTTWNFANFQYVVPSFDLSAYEQLLLRLTQKLRPFTSADIATLDLSQHEQPIVDAFDELAAIRGIKFTGAAKMLHLINPWLFIPWDRAISGCHTPKSDYTRLEVIQSGFWKPPKYPFAQSGEGYFEFLRYCQSRFMGFTSPDRRKTLAKCIDEYNYCMITKKLPKKPSTKKKSR